MSKNCNSTSKLNGANSSPRLSSKTKGTTTKWKQIKSTFSNEIDNVKISSLCNSNHCAANIISSNECAVTETKLSDFSNNKLIPANVNITAQNNHYVNNPHNLDKNRPTKCIISSDPTIWKPINRESTAVPSRLNQPANNYLTGTFPKFNISQLNGTSSNNQCETRFINKKINTTINCGPINSCKLNNNNNNIEDTTDASYIMQRNNEKKELYHYLGISKNPTRNADQEDQDIPHKKIPKRTSTRTRLRTYLNSLKKVTLKSTKKCKDNSNASLVNKNNGSSKIRMDRSNNSCGLGTTASTNGLVKTIHNIMTVLPSAKSTYTNHTASTALNSTNVNLFVNDNNNNIGKQVITFNSPCGANISIQKRNNKMIDKQSDEYTSTISSIHDPKPVPELCKPQISILQRMDYDKPREIQNYYVELPCAYLGINYVQKMYDTYFSSNKNTTEDARKNEVETIHDSTMPLELTVYHIEDVKEEMVSGEPKQLSVMENDALIQHERIHSNQLQEINHTITAAEIPYTVSIVTPSEPILYTSTAQNPKTEMIIPDMQTNRESNKTKTTTTETFSPENPATSSNCNETICYMSTSPRFMSAPEVDFVTDNNTTVTHTIKEPIKSETATLIDRQSLENSIRTLSSIKKDNETATMKTFSSPTSSQRNFNGDLRFSNTIVYHSAFKGMRKKDKANNKKSFKYAKRKTSKDQTSNTETNTISNSTNSETTNIIDATSTVIPNPTSDYAFLFDRTTNAETTPESSVHVHKFTIESSNNTNRNAIQIKKGATNTNVGQTTKNDNKKNHKFVLNKIAKNQCRILRSKNSSYKRRLRKLQQRPSQSESLRRLKIRDCYKKPVNKKTSTPVTLSQSVPLQPLYSLTTIEPYTNDKTSYDGNVIHETSINSLPPDGFSDHKTGNGSSSQQPQPQPQPNIKSIPIPSIWNNFLEPLNCTLLQNVSKGSIINCNINRNPLHQADGNILNAFYVNKQIIIVQDTRISFWQYPIIVNVAGVNQTWELIGDITRKINDIEIRAPYACRMCMNEGEPVYIECRARKMEPNNFRLSVLTKFYVNVYFIKRTTTTTQSNGTELSMLTINLDQIWGSPDSFCYTALPNSRYFVLSWVEEGLRSTLQGVCKYSLAPSLETLASIRMFQSSTSEIHTLSCTSESKLVGFGSSVITIWDYNTGDLLWNVDLKYQIGENLGSMIYDENQIKYLFIAQLCDIYENGKILKLMAVNLSDSSSWKIICTHDLPNGCTDILSIIRGTELLTVTFKRGGSMTLNMVNARSIYIRQPIIDKPIIQTFLQNNHVIQISKDYLILRTINEFYLDLNMLN